MSVSERDRTFMRRIGRYKAESHADALADHLSLSLSERLARGWQLYLAGRSSGSTDTRLDDPGPLYMRARELGLYQ